MREKAPLATLTKSCRREEAPLTMLTPHSAVVIDTRVTEERAPLFTLCTKVALVSLGGSVVPTVGPTVHELEEKDQKPHHYSILARVGLGQSGTEV